MPSIRPLALAAAAALSLLAALPAQAQPRAAEERIERQYRADKLACERRLPQREDICEERAKGKREVALAELDHRRQPTRENAERREHARVKARYEVEKEKCDRLRGREESRCERRAEAQYDRETAAIERRYRR